MIRSLVSYYGLSQRDVASKLGKSPQHISHVLAVFELIGAGKDWIIEPGEVWLSKQSKVNVHPTGGGYKVDFTFSNTEELEQVVEFLRGRLKEQK